VSDDVVLVCPAGAETALISEGAIGYEAFHHRETGRWYVVVPMTVAAHLCWNGGFYRAPDHLQGLRPQ
jgi:hypothetical protein